MDNHYFFEVMPHFAKNIVIGFARLGGQLVGIVATASFPGRLPTGAQWYAKVVYAYAEATVPKITLITRKTYRGAYIVMSSKPTGTDVKLTYPMAEIAVMGTEEKSHTTEAYNEQFSNPY